MVRVTTLNISQSLKPRSGRHICFTMVRADAKPKMSTEDPVSTKRSLQSAFCTDRRRSDDVTSVWRMETNDDLLASAKTIWNGITGLTLTFARQPFMKKSIASLILSMQEERERSVWPAVIA